jgi:hypothetical protein
MTENALLAHRVMRPGGNKIVESRHLSTDQIVDNPEEEPDWSMPGIVRNKDEHALPQKINGSEPLFANRPYFLSG